MHRLLYGAHMSIAGGLDKAIIAGQSIGCTTIQLFTKSNRQWTANELTDTEIESYKIAVANLLLTPWSLIPLILLILGPPKKI